MATLAAKRGSAVMEHEEEPMVAETEPVMVDEGSSFLARMRPGGTTREDAGMVSGQGSMGTDNSAIVEHKSAGQIRLYKKEAWGGWRPVAVPANSKANLLEAGYRETCGDCNGHHSEKPNDCPGRPALKFRVCPSPNCGKRFYDTGIDYTKDDSAAPAEPGMISDEQSHETTPEERTLGMMNQHIRWFHEGLAYERGLMAAGGIADQGRR